MAATDVQGAIDELYNTCFPPKTLGDQILENAQLEKDPYECRYFFTGANPNNYITFNNETAGWRIMSVECDGTIKIVKREDVGGRSQYWDSVGTNSWARPASLNTYLNGTYYNSLTSTAQSQVVAHDFSVGVATYNNNDLATQITSENGTKWNGKIALATVSEYLRTNSNMANCGTYSLYVNNFNTCKTMTWLFDGSNDWWTLSADGYISSDNSNGLVNYITDYGVLTSKVAGDMTNAIPVLYLSSAITITDGDGTQSNPFTLG